MEGLGVLLVVVAAFLANLPALREQWRTDRAGSIKTIWLFGLYLLYIGLGIVAVLLLAPKTGGASGGKALLLTLFILGFIFYGGLTLMRVGAALPRASGVAYALRHRRHRPARSHLRLPRWLSVGISLLLSGCSLNVLAARCNLARVELEAVELSLNGGFSDVCPGHHRRL